MTEQPGKAARDSSRRRVRVRAALIGLAAVVIVSAGATAVLARLGSPLQPEPFVVALPEAGGTGSPAQLADRAARAWRSLARLRPRGVY
ncbi:hypothetical protein RZS08_42010, partial [Arthrospira platensis SPKY1]|nr:hypothetical protein [Arthrospira platensis SPKY1]